MTVPNTSAETPKPTPAEKITIAEFVTYLKECGFCKIDDSTANQTRLFNRFTGDKFFPSMLESKFDDWCRVNSKKATYPGSRYVMRTLVHVVGHRFDPTGNAFSIDPRSHLRYVNLYERYTPKGLDVPLSPLWQEFWERLIADPTQRHQALQWIAHIFQHPGERPSYHLMWPSEPGTGKGFLLEKVLHPLLIHTEIAPSYDKVMGRFSTMLETSILVLLDDCKTSSDSTQTKLKSILSEERQHVERKHAQGGMVRSYTRFILASNEARPLYLDPDERRWLVFNKLVHRTDRAETQAFIAKLAAWLEAPGALDAVYNWFLGYDLAGFNHKNPPASTALQAMVELSVNPHEEFAAGFIKDNIVFQLAELQRAFKEDGLAQASPSHVPHIMRKLGYAKAQLLIDGSRNTYYFPIGYSREQVQGVRKGDARVVQEVDGEKCPF